MSAQALPLIDYHNANATHSLLPNPSVLSSSGLSSSGWHDLHLEVFQQPKFEIAEHRHSMHVIAHSPVSDRFSSSAPGERWLDGKLCREDRQPGAIAIIPAGTAHRCNWSASVEFMILAIEPGLLQQVGQDFVPGDRIELIPQFMNQTDPLIQGIFSTLRKELECGSMSGHLLVDSFKTTLAIHLLRSYCTTQPKLSSYKHGLSQAKLRQIKEYINAHLNADLKLTELSAIAQISPYHFLRLFKQQMEITPHQYILQQRIEQAKHLLQNSELSLAEIAGQTGFSDQSHLTKCFKRKFGITPKKLMRDRLQMNLKSPK